MADNKKYDSFGYLIRSSIPQDLHIEVVKVFGWDTDENGNVIPVETGEKDFQKEVDSHIEETNIKPALERALASGDSSFLMMKSKEYGDDTIIPDNIIDLKDASDKASAVSKSTGVSLDEASLDKYIKNAIAEALAAKASTDNKEEK